MSTLSKAIPCVPFVLFPKNTQPWGDYVQVKKDGYRCSSKIGRRGSSQPMSLSGGCLSKGIIMHEMLHALGLLHEQGRFDRDNLITINWNNIIPGRQHNFRITTERVATFDVPYNQMSIMHYGSQYFSRNGEPTIVSKVHKLYIIFLKLKRMYNC